MGRPSAALQSRTKDSLQQAVRRAAAWKRAGSGGDRIHCGLVVTVLTCGDGVADRGQTPEVLGSIAAHARMCPLSGSCSRRSMCVGLGAPKSYAAHLRWEGYCEAAGVEIDIRQLRHAPVTEVIDRWKPSADASATPPPKPPSSTHSPTPRSAPRPMLTSGYAARFCRLRVAPFSGRALAHYSAVYDAHRAAHGAWSGWSPIRWVGWLRMCCEAGGGLHGRPRRWADWCPPPRLWLSGAVRGVGLVWGPSWSGCRPRRRGVVRGRRRRVV